MELIPTGADVNGLFSGSASPDFTDLGSKALFEGSDADFFPNLWVTDGTAAGTHELTGVSGALSGGLHLSDMTVFGNQVVFAGEDASNRIDLWITDGTSAGTKALIPAGADPTGLLAQPAGGPDFTVLGNKVLFAGRDTNFHLDLWVTDGTSAGTSAPIPAGADPVGLLSVGVGGPDFTAIIYLTKERDINQTASRQAGVEIEITEEMISAGAEIILRAHGDAVIEGEYGSFDVREVAERAYRAMRLFEPDPSDQSRRAHLPVSLDKQIREQEKPES